MQPELILLRFGELTLKGRNRSRFEDMVISHIRKLTGDYSEIRIVKTYGRVYIQLNGAPYEGVAQQLKKVFGLRSFSPVMRAELELADIQRTALQVMQNLPEKPRTFKVISRRSYKQFEYTSMELNRHVSGYVLSRTPDLKVDVHEPDVELWVEVRQEGVYVFSEIVYGLGGFPYGSNGKAMLMLSGGIDSPVAGWLAMKRGLRIEAVHFHSYPYTSERAKQKVIELTRKLSTYAKEIRLHLVPFTEIQVGFKEEAPERLLVTLMRRAMFRITEQLAVRNDALAIVTGESLGQVASQTLKSLNTIERAVAIPVLRPLITMDKLDIIRIAEEIDTYKISILPYEDCCTIFQPRSPSTHPNLELVEKIERGLPWLDERIAEAVEHTELMVISEEAETSELDDLF
ncbi:putative tRNA sulfurtransferase [Insulibacter thermoxylanivorax]|uniref:Probable tRNA sulfurtransferase n=1 Tax=Insulibacter thermoxylanivorax TaxID=2749268 RepID=A0A916QEE5_9BACL|nr:tRNA uracil 4-sulfurtransferase ThiI [Insulibacter thermoxylanivorax]GFR37434.1 putative tRNA sulfurtransferase [Insulibacter thermoxylanivorax]